MKTYAVGDLPKNKIIEFFRLHWGSPEMVTSSGIYDYIALDGIDVVYEEDEIIGLITYIIKDKECEILSYSMEEGKGIGTSLVQEEENLAIKKN